MLMKKNYLENGRLSILILMLFTIVFSSCEVDDFTEAVPTGNANAAPAVTIAVPGDTVVISLSKTESFQITIESSDDSPGLSFLEMQLINSQGEELFSAERAISGTTNSSTFNVPDSLLDIGSEYEIITRVDDTQGKSIEVTSNFIGSDLLSNEDAIYLIGNFTGDGDVGNPNYREVPMRLIDNFTWEIATWLDEADPEFVFSNSNVSGGTEYGASATDVCDNIANGSEPISCPITGNNVIIRFNDETLEYSITEPDSNEDRLFLIGEYNGWGGSNDRFALVDNNQWEADVTGVFGQFKFVDNSDFGGKDWSDPGCDGVAEQQNGSDNTNCGFDGDFKIRFNDSDFSYSFEAL